MSGSSHALKAPGLIRRLGAWPAYAALALFVLLPLAGLVLELIWDDTDIVSRVREDRLVMAALANTLALGAGTASVSLIVGALLARSVARLGARKRQLMIVLLGVPLTFSGLVIAYGFILAFGRAGVITQLLALAGANPAEVGKWIYTTAGLAFAYAYYLVPRVALILVPLFANLDRRPFHAALTLGAPPGVRGSIPIFVNSPLVCCGVVPHLRSGHGYLWHGAGTRRHADQHPAAPHLSENFRRRRRLPDGRCTLASAPRRLPPGAGSGRSADPRSGQAPCQWMNSPCPHRN